MTTTAPSFRLSQGSPILQITQKPFGFLRSGAVSVWADFVPDTGDGQPQLAGAAGATKVLLAVCSDGDLVLSKRIQAPSCDTHTPLEEVCEYTVQLVDVAAQPVSQGFGRDPASSVLEKDDGTRSANQLAVKHTSLAVRAGYFQVFLVMCKPYGVPINGSVTVRMSNPVDAWSELSSEEIAIVFSCSFFVAAWLVGMIVWFGRCIRHADQFKRIFMVRLISIFIVTVLLVELVRFVVQSFLTFSIQLLLSKGLSIVRTHLTFVERDNLVVLVCAAMCIDSLYSFGAHESIFGVLVIIVAIYITIACNVRHVLITLEAHIHALISSADGQRVGIGDNDSHETWSVEMVRLTLGRVFEAIWPRGNKKTIEFGDPWDLVSVYQGKLRVMRSARYYLLFWGLLPVVIKSLDIIKFDSHPFPSIAAAQLGQLVIFGWFM
ncbi:hypothetical protein HK105_208288 [Polyrhizophydium stewartii]|uniref:Uncharacterized protein n=1 Tax=Polyrhizophydium stewartii TaxID=2732419 RepID=A0ABR4MYC0_9FUNG